MRFGSGVNEIQSVLLQFGMTLVRTQDKEEKVKWKTEPSDRFEGKWVGEEYVIVYKPEHAGEVELYLWCEQQGDYKACWDMLVKTLNGYRVAPATARRSHTQPTTAKATFSHTHSQPQPQSDTAMATATASHTGTEITYLCKF